MPIVSLCKNAANKILNPVTHRSEDFGDVRTSKSIFSTKIQIAVKDTRNTFLHKTIYRPLDKWAGRNHLKIVRHDIQDCSANAGKIIKYANKGEQQLNDYVEKRLNLKMRALHQLIKQEINVDVEKYYSVMDAQTEARVLRILKDLSKDHPLNFAKIKENIAKAWIKLCNERIALKIEGKIPSQELDSKILYLDFMRFCTEAIE